MKKLICRAVGTENGITTVVASTDDVHRYEDVDAQHWSLEAFKNNPVIVFGHDYSSAPVGKATQVEVIDGKLVAQIEWDDDEDNPAGKRTARQFAQGFMSAVSVGFAPGQSVRRNQLDEDNVHAGPSGMVYGTPESPNVLLEISAVPIPANPQALALRNAPEASSAPIDVRSELLYLLKTDETLKSEIAALAADWSEAEPSPLAWVAGKS